MFQNLVDRGSQEEVHDVVEGELEVTIDRLAQIAGAGLVAIVMSGIPHRRPGRHRRLSGKTGFSIRDALDSHLGAAGLSSAQITAGARDIDKRLGDI